MRDLALAQALQARGASCTFAAPEWGERLLQRFATKAPAVQSLPRSGDPVAIARALDGVEPDVLVLDDYDLTAADVALLRRPGLRIVVIDDLADRPYDCDLLVDPGFGRNGQDYAGLTPPGCRVLTGPGHALLRAGFAEGARPKMIAAQVSRVFVSFGLSDVDAVTVRVVEHLRTSFPMLVFDIALASDAASLPRLRALAGGGPYLNLHPDARDVVSLMKAADVAVGAGGSATWERCALGLPTLAVVVADNQRAMIGRLAKADAVLQVDLGDPDFDERLLEMFGRLLDPAVRRALSQVSGAVCDGRGAARVAEAILALAEA